MSPDHSHPKPLKAGDLIAGRYRLVEILGQGGFGVVYRAKQQPLDREVALKLLHVEQIADREALSRFLREAALAQELEHPNVVRLYDVGQTEEGQPFIAYQLLRGSPLDHLIVGEAPLPAGRVANLAAQALKALMATHALGIVHRDVKPENLFVVEAAGLSDHLMLLDLGIARLMGADVTALTAQGTVIGSPCYMAPEQVRGEEIGPATDLYALGLVMAEMLTGQQAVSGPDLLAICQAQASPTPAELSPVVTASTLGAVIRRATQKDRRLRYERADQMLGDLLRTPFADPLRRSQPLSSPGPHGTSEEALAETLVAPLSSEEALAETLAAPRTAAPATRHVAAPALRQAAPRSGRAAFWVLVGAGATLLVLVAGAVFGLVALSERRGGGPSSAAPLQATGAAPAQERAAPDELALKLGRLTGAKVRQAFADAGWTAKTSTVLYQETDHVWSRGFVFEREGRSANVNLTQAMVVHPSHQEFSEQLGQCSMNTRAGHRTLLLSINYMTFPSEGCGEVRLLLSRLLE